MIPHLFFTMANEKDSELEACEYLDMFARKCGFAKDTVDEMRLAFIEGLINAKEHAPKDIADGNKRLIDVAFTFENDALNIQIRDFGKGFDPGLVEKPDIRKKLKSSYKRGWGLMLMEKLMDGAEITSFPPSGTLIHLVKKRFSADSSQAEVDTLKEHNRNERLKYILSSFIDLSSFLCQSKNLQSGLRSMLRILLGTIGVSRGAIYTFSPAKKTLECFVDIKLRANARLPRASIPENVIAKLAASEAAEVTDLIKHEIPAFKETFKESEIERVYMLRAENENLGLLVLGARFHKNDEEGFDNELLTIVSRNISSAINTFRLMQSLREANLALDARIDELNSVREASKVISSELELENLPNTVEDIFANVMNIGKFSMVVKDATENRFNICPNGRDLPSQLDLWSSPISQHVIQSKEPLFIKNTHSDERFSFIRAKSYSSTSCIVIPIIVQGEVLGLINLTDKKGEEPLTEHDFELAQLLCSQLGIAIKNANLYKQGISDSLTQLYSNHYFKMRLTQEISRHRRTKSPLSLIMLCVSNIEGIIEQFGMAARDSVISRVGLTIKRVTRFNDLPCRCEGDKFAIIMPDTNNSGCHTAAEKIMAQAKLLSFKQNGKEIQFCISLSMVEFDSAMTAEQLIARANKLLGKAPKTGCSIIEA